MVLQIKEDGYLVEVHRIFAEDGQMLTLHRIPGPSRLQRYSWNVYSGHRQPVLIMHGYLGSSQSWLTQPRTKALPYLLADEGYDVWLGNFRTNYYSRSHLKYSTSDRRFWDVSYNEIGVYDLPANIGHILTKTGFSQVIYIGHSMGTTTFLVMASSRPEYNAKIKAAFFFSPILLPIKKDRFTPILKAVYSYADTAYKLLRSQKMYEFLPRSEPVISFVNTSCGPGMLQSLCLQFFGQRYNLPDKNVNLKEFGRIATGMVAGTSIKISHHLLQLFNSGIRQYDYGPKINQQVYGTTTAPEYPLHRVSAPLYIYYGLNDILMDPEGVRKLGSIFPNVVLLSPVEDPYFTHADFLVGNNAKEVLYDRILYQMQYL